MFTNRQKWSCPPLQMNGRLLEWQKTAKYLGVTLDDKLNWSAHIAAKIKKAKKQLFLYRQIVGQQFGPEPRYMKWMYTGIIRPSLCYGALVWWRVAAKTGNHKKLSQLNRLAIMTWGSMRRSSPTSGLEIMSGIPPIDLFLEGEVVKAWCRIEKIRVEIWDGIGEAALGHRLELKRTSAEFGLNKYSWDEISELKKPTRLYKVDRDSLKHGKNQYGKIKCYTDGSRIKGRAGAGYCITVNDMVVAEKAYPLGPFPTVFQAEIVAIREAAKELQKMAERGETVFFCDSQAAILALDKPTVSSMTVLETMLELDNLAEKQDVKLSWLKAHVGTQGNERADTLAKEGSRMEVMEDGPKVRTPSCQQKRDILDEIHKRWTERWSLLNEARQSKIFWPAPDRIRSERLVKYSREEFGTLVQFFTGHNHFNRHQFLLKESESAMCRLCSGAEETAEHLFCSCPSLNEARYRALGAYQVCALEGSLAPLQTIRNFLFDKIVPALEGAPSVAQVATVNQL
jgi:ribonuclease HI